MRRAGWLVLVAACACSRPPPAAVEAPRIAVVDTEALQKLVRGVDASRQPERRAEAADLLKQAVAKDPNLWEARYNLGVLLAGLGRLEESEAQLRRAFELAPNAEDVAIALGEVRRRRGDPGKAAADLLAFVSRTPEALDARVVLVAALRESRQLDAAVEHARAVLVHRAGDPNALSELALTHLEKGERDTAELLSREALRAEPRTATAERTAGLVALRAGDDATAFRHFVRASELDPNDTTARFNMAAVLLRAGVHDRAAREYRAVLAVAPEDPGAILGLAAALRGQGRRDAPEPYVEAKKLLTEVLERQPDHLEATFNLAVLEADVLRQPDAARGLFERYLRAAPATHPGRSHAEQRLAALRAAPAGRAP
jgi:tetratricopeptide (TPR) repeat protein